VKEITIGIDIVQAQINAAQGVALDLAQGDVEIDGHAFECRINAEDPDTFLASAGTITALKLPSGPGIRVDSHVHAGYKVPPYYDSLIGKLIVHAPTRSEAIAAMRTALAETEIEGISTNLPLLRALFDDDGFAAGGTDIHYLEKWLKRRSAS
jgi:acetyl-CoA carboxylase biotin carboxylase subunit